MVIHGVGMRNQPARMGQNAQPLTLRRSREGPFRFHGAIAKGAPTHSSKDLLAGKVHLINFRIYIAPGLSFHVRHFFD